MDFPKPRQMRQMLMIFWENETSIGLIKGLRLSEGGEWLKIGNVILPLSVSKPEFFSKVALFRSCN